MTKPWGLKAASAEGESGPVTLAQWAKVWMWSQPHGGIASTPPHPPTARSSRGSRRAGDAPLARGMAQRRGRAEAAGLSGLLWSEQP
eukprot:COSAG04_NODE_6_length_47123_cov_87.347482_6_plen_87_part_00